MRRAQGSLMEMPASTVRVAGINLPIAGGGYFRLLPYGWTRWGIRHVNQVENEAVVFYLHPWELDPEQPRISAALTTRVRHYGGLRRTVPRLRRLLQDFQFDSLATVLKAVHRIAA